MSETFRISPSASARIAEIIKAQDNKEGLALRVAVNAGGCNGFQYQFKLERDRREDDTIFGQEHAAVLVDSASLPLLEGAELDFVDKLMGAHFIVHNPNAASSCGCGSSFSLG
ncbi:iron-sulfur cluster insertion protein ErpA [Acetobacteraceae bacterium ESL0709]|nr:iron-sulfur cluster insertion protein ErpA [Acetobacteraceae bacterium ESL0697]MDF7677676.1 iron-sulfur cluster insertion protein ErpA [Acetobacteraceae bacterium ESL0709]